jgi:hypothetical protein
MPYVEGHMAHFVAAVLNCRISHAPWPDHMSFDLPIIDEDKDLISPHWSLIRIYKSVAPQVNEHSAGWEWLTTYPFKSCDQTALYTRSSAV